MKRLKNYFGLYLFSRPVACGNWLCLVVLFAVTGIACESTKVTTEFNNRQTIRIAVLKDTEELAMRIRGHYKIIDPMTKELLVEGRRLSLTKIIPVPEGIKVGERLYKRNRLQFIPSKDVAIRMHHINRRYRGKMDVIRNKDNRFLVVNQCNLEDYIKGVLYHETSHRWPMAALKVQAVAARTYALYQMENNKEKNFDVTSDIYSQVYGGRTSERYRTNLAVSGTKGQILSFGGHVLPAYYHATCGNITENVTELWAHEDLLPLRGVKCGFCTHSPHYRWKRNFRLKDIQDKLNAGDFALGLIREINVVERNQSGRIRKLQILTRDGKETILSGKKFRDLVGPNMIRSNDYRVVMKGYYCDLLGKGWGHGVGMCQWGTHQMARQRHTYKEILQYYYPGTEISDYKTFRNPS